MGNQYLKEESGELKGHYRRLGGGDTGLQGGKVLEDCEEGY